MAQIVDMPQLSDTMREGVLRKWRKNEGEKIVPGELFAEVETDKATMDWEAYDEGTLLKKLVADGSTVPVGTPIAILGNPGEDITALVAEAAARAGGAGGKKQPAAVAPAAAAPKAAPPPAAPAPATAPAAAAAPPAPSAAPSAPTAPAARPSAAAPAAPSPSNGAKISGTKVLASPLARRLATDLGIDLRGVKGSGPGGRIVERDVQAASASGGSAAPAAAEPVAPPAPPAAAPAPAPAPAPLPAQLIPERRAEARPAAVVPPPADDIQKPLSLMRKTIARRLVESKTTIPHFYLTTQVDMDAAMEFREQVSQVHGTKLSVNDLVLKAAALALRKLPEANASFTEDAIVQHARVDIGMAVAIEDGLVTPVLRGADKKTLGQLSNEARELAARARDRKLRPEEMTGGTFSVSNLGMLGVDHFAAIINPPESAILAVGRVRKEPVVKNDKIVIGQRMFLTLSCDHRVVDGAIGAKLLQAIVAILERPITLAF